MTDQTSGASGDGKLVAERGSGNIYADLGYSDANAMALKAGLALSLQDLIKRRGLTQAMAAKLTGISQPDLSRLLRGQFRDFSSDRMVRALTQLSADVEISVYANGDQVGDRIRLQAAPVAAIA
jgi:predicted XRE-type DNA-binding protein